MAEQNGLRATDVFPFFSTAQSYLMRAYFGGGGRLTVFGPGVARTSFLIETQIPPCYSRAFSPSFESPRSRDSVFHF
jgi:hypothetical protein